MNEFESRIPHANIPTNKGIIMHRLCIETVTGKVWRSVEDELTDEAKGELANLTSDWKTLDRVQFNTDVGEVHFNPAHIVAIWFEEVPHIASL